jgi:hypothetical protein
METDAKDRRALYWVGWQQANKIQQPNQRKNQTQL